MWIVVPVLSSAANENELLILVAEIIIVSGGIIVTNLFRDRGEEFD